MRIQYDVPYSSNCPDSRTLDLWLPEEPNGAGILLIHGGGWAKGDKKQFADVAGWFAERGFVCASMKYRLSTEAVYPAAVEDARLAVQYLRSKANELGFRPERLAAVGSSAGGHLAAMLATVASDDALGRTDELHQLDTRPNAVALYCPVTTLHVDKGFVRSFMGAAEEEFPELYREASPVDRITGDEPPCLILQGDEDLTTPLEEAEVFAERLAAAGSNVELLKLEGVGHGFGYGIHTEAQRQACERILVFLTRVFHLSP